MLSQFVLLQFDLQNFGAKIFQDLPSKNRQEKVSERDLIHVLTSWNSFSILFQIDSTIVQLVKLTNVSAPKENQESQGAPAMFRLTLTDGHTNIAAIEMEKINKLK